MNGERTNLMVAPREKKAMKIFGLTALILVLGLMAPQGVWAGDWSADSLGEGSGIDRGAAMMQAAASSSAVPVAAAQPGAAQALTVDEAGMRAMIQEVVTPNQMSNAFNYSAAVGEVFNTSGFGAMAVPSGGGGGGEDMEE